MLVFSVLTLFHERRCVKYLPFHAKNNKKSVTFAQIKDKMTNISLKLLN